MRPKRLSNFSIQTRLGPNEFEKFERFREMKGLTVSEIARELIAYALKDIEV